MRSTFFIFMLVAFIFVPAGLEKALADWAKTVIPRISPQPRPVRRSMVIILKTLAISRYVS